MGLTRTTGKKARSNLISRSEPYRDLYIYLFNGLVSPEDEKLFGESFVGNWVEGESSFLFFEAPAESVFTHLLRNRPDLQCQDEYHFTYAEWQGGGLSPLRIENFLISPPWHRPKFAEGTFSMILDPGVVFGNGLHPTTRDCLKALCFIREKSFLRRVVDLGTGTGILALAAAILGAEKVLAMDLNPLCVRTAAQNVILNGLEKKIEVFGGRAEDFVKDPVDLVIANIHYEVILNLLDKKGICDSDRLIISGLMRSQWREVIPELSKNRFGIVKEWDHEMTWFTILAERE